MKAIPLRTLVSAIGLFIAITTAISVPAGYFAVTYAHLAGLLDLKAEVNARYLSKYIYTHETLWQYQTHDLVELLDQTKGAFDDVHKRVVDSAGKLVLEDGRQPAVPVLVRRSPILVSGEKVGDVEIAATMRQLAIDTALVGSLSIMLGFGMFFAVRVFPLRVLDQTLGALETTNRRFDLALSNMAQGLCMFDAEERMFVWNQRFLAIFELTPEAVRVGMPLAEFIAVVAARNNLFLQTADVIMAERKRMLQSGQSAVWLRELSDGRVLSIMHQPIPAGGWLSTFEDITDRRKAEAKITHMAHHDALTNLPNRLLFREQMEHALGHLRRDQRLAVLCLDLDHFKNVNDTLGHPVGDTLLKAVARRLRDCVRESDTIARLGGDEFAILYVGEDLQPTELTALASRLVDVLGAPYSIDGHQMVVGVSVGIAMAPTDGTDPDQLLKNADLALYRAKSDGRGTYRFFEQEMDARAQARRVLELDLRAAIANSEFELYYQPILNLDTDTVVSVEALVRWRHPQRGMIPPMDFIPLAEETGMIVPLGEWILRQACSEAARWPHDICVAVNLSPVQFKNRSLMPAVINAIAAAGLAPGRLELEITESVLLQESEATLAKLHSLRNFGVRISMDDFGTGYSSLSYLRSFPFDKIKIDRSFIKELSTRDDSMAIVRAVTGLGKSLGITTTAEGVETSEQLALLRSEGCTEVQGYLFSRPLPAAGIEQLLAKDTEQRAVA